MDGFVKGYNNISHIGLYERMNKLFYGPEKSQSFRKVKKGDFLRCFYILVRRGKD